MPIKKFRLSRAEQAEYRAAAQQLRAQGLIPKISEWLESSPPLDILTRDMSSVVSELPSGTVYYAIWVQLVARQAGLILVDCQITTSWDDQIILGSDEVNFLCSPGGPAYSSDGVLNERIENSLRFHRCGDMVRGTIFFWGLRPIPDAYRTNAIVPFEMTFTDSLGNQLATEGAVHVNRRRESTQKMQRRKHTLFDDTGMDYESISEKSRRAYLLTLAEEKTRASGGNDVKPRLNRIRTASGTCERSGQKSLHDCVYRGGGKLS
jgi:hypothetical protein